MKILKRGILVEFTNSIAYQTRFENSSGNTNYNISTLTTHITTYHDFKSFRVWNDYPYNIPRCYDKGEATNNFEAILVWEKDQTFLFANYENIDAQFDCNSQKYALVWIIYPS